MGQDDTKQCKRCEETKRLGEFYRYGTGKLMPECKLCYKEYQRQWREDRKKKRVISQENKDFFHLGATAKDDQIRDLEKALNIAEKTIKALVTVIKEADARDYKRCRIPA